MNNNQRVDILNEKAASLDAQGIIRLAVQEFGSRCVVASSLGEEDQVITDMIARIAPESEIFTLDTGRLFPETYALLAKTQKRYPMTFRVYYPQTGDVEAMVMGKGLNLFYESVENRKWCCHVRKVEPLGRALKGAEAWMCGLRRAQSLTRSGLKVFEQDPTNGKMKISPLAFWSLEDVRRYITENNVDVNPLHAKGFISIGCACCTRAVRPGEDIRSGRWWWEQPEQKECGLHNNPGRPG